KAARIRIRITPTTARVSSTTAARATAGCAPAATTSTRLDITRRATRRSLRARGDRLDGVRSVLRGVHGTDVSESHVPTRRRDRSHQQYLRAEHAADDLGSDRGGRPHRALLLSG